MQFSFIQISDTHILADESGRLHGFSPGLALRKVLEHIAAHQAGQFDFLAITGDLVNSATPQAYQTFMRLAGLPEQPARFPGPLRAAFGGLSDVPVYCLPGNHDDRETFYRQLFPHSAAGEWANAAHLHQGVQLIFLDLGPGERPAISQPSLDFLRQSLQSGPPALLLLHHNVAPIGSRWLDKYLSKEIGLFWRELAGRPVLGIFCGHTHVNYEVSCQGVPVFGVSSTAIPFVVRAEHLLQPLLPPHYRLVTVRDTQVSSHTVAVDL